MNKFDDEFVFLNVNMEDFNFEDEWVIGEHRAPYFELYIGFYRYINENEVARLAEVFQIGFVNGRRAVIYRPRKY